jgi:hypothetical protein
LFYRSTADKVLDNTHIPVILFGDEDLAPAVEEGSPPPSCQGRSAKPSRDGGM